VEATPEFRGIFEENSQQILVSRIEAASMIRTGILAGVLLVASGCTDERQRVCHDLGNQHINRMKEEFKQNYTNLRTQDFYSPAIDACIHVEESIVGVNVEIRDTSNGLLKDGLHNVLLHCDEDGANSVIIGKVREHGGAMFEVPYVEWLDDGFGGPPRTLKTPDRPYTREQCARVLKKWVALLKQTG
jgi:hypothetical protein